MSMFHELMMRKKEQIMYATIKGTLTENDGVFSGFSSSNYLALQQPFTLNSTTKAEINLKVNFSSIGNGYGIIGTFGSYGLLLNINNQSKLALYLGDKNSSFNILNGTLQSKTEVSINTDYWIKIKFDNGVVSLLLSIDGINYDGNSVNITIGQELSYDLYYGVGRIGTSYHRGSIDLNNSYIKLGSTKYNLQAVVGYTIVGSPTITDGVVSGFSSSDYLSTVYGVFPDFEEDFELQIKFTTGANVSNSLLIGTNTSLINGFRIVSSQLNMTLRYDTSKQNTVSYTLVANTTYYAKALKKGTSLICSLYDENKVLLATNTTTLPETGFSKGNYMYIGYGTSGAFEGSIYLNETYIKINNKLWFNGQQA